jgi:hypothetical protein
MQVPEHLHGIATEVVVLEREAAINRAYWAVVLGLVPMRDGDQWCILWGGDIQSGIAAFGSSPVEAIYNFDVAMSAKIPPAPVCGKENPPCTH